MKKKFLVVPLLISVFSFSLPALSLAHGGGMMDEAGETMNWPGWGFGLVLMFLFWGLVVVGVITLIRWMADRGKPKTRTGSALSILEKRYAKGEIDKKEYQEKKKDLLRS